MVAIWEGFLRLYHVPKIIGRSPLDVYHYLFTAKASKVHRLRSAAGNRKVLFHNAKTTLRDAILGYVAGIVMAMLVACVFVLCRAVEQTFMPIAVAAAAFPLFAMIPLITLIFGRDIMSVADDRRHRVLLPGAGQHHVRPAVGVEVERST